MTSAACFATISNQTGIYIHWLILFAAPLLLHTWDEQANAEGDTFVSSNCWQVSNEPETIWTVFTGNVIMGLGGIHPCARDFRAESMPRIREDVCGISNCDPLMIGSVSMGRNRGNPVRTWFAWHPPDHRPQEPWLVEDGGHGLIHERVRFDEIQGIVRKFIGGCIFF